MSMVTEHGQRHYVVRLAIRATAADPSGAVRDALDAVLRAGLENITYRVDDVGSGATFAITPADDATEAARLFPSWGDRVGADGEVLDHDDDEDYHGQFLG